MRITSGHWTLWQIFNWAVTKVQGVVSAITGGAIHVIVVLFSYNKIISFYILLKQEVVLIKIASHQHDCACHYGQVNQSSISEDITSLTMSLGSWDNLILSRDGASWSDYRDMRPGGCQADARDWGSLTPTLPCWPGSCVITARLPTLSSRHPVQL